MNNTEKNLRSMAVLVLHQDLQDLILKTPNRQVREKDIHMEKHSEGNNI